MHGAELLLPVSEGLQIPRPPGCHPRSWAVFGRSEERDLPTWLEWLRALGTWDSQAVEVHQRASELSACWPGDASCPSLCPAQLHRPLTVLLTHTPQSPSLSSCSSRCQGFSLTFKVKFICSFVSPILIIDLTPRQATYYLPAATGS